LFQLRMHPHLLGKRMETGDHDDYALELRACPRQHSGFPAGVKTLTNEPGAKTAVEHKRLPLA
jgi:hypothetical protein